MSRYNMYWMSLEGGEIGITCGEDKIGALDHGFRQLGFNDISEYSYYYPGRICELLSSTDALISKLNGKITVDAEDDSIRKHYRAAIEYINGTPKEMVHKVELIGTLCVDRISNTYIFPTVNTMCGIFSAAGVFVSNDYYMICSDWEG